MESVLDTSRRALWRCMVCLVGWIWMIPEIAPLASLYDFDCGLLLLELACSYSLHLHLPPYLPTSIQVNDRFL